MGLLTLLTTNGGSSLSIANGNEVFINPLSTRESQLHYDLVNNQPGYSVIGSKAQFLQVNPNFQQYVDGVENSLPLSTTLDIEELENNDPNYPLIYKPTNKYQNYPFNNEPKFII